MCNFAVFVMNLGAAFRFTLVCSSAFSVLNIVLLVVLDIKYIVRSLAGAGPGYELLTHLKIITGEGEAIVYRG